MIERYSRKVMRDVWTEHNKFSAYLKVEILASEAWSKLGVVPAEDVQSGGNEVLVGDDNSVIVSIDEVKGFL